VVKPLVLLHAVGDGGVQMWGCVLCVRWLFSVWQHAVCYAAPLIIQEVLGKSTLVVAVVPVLPIRTSVAKNLN
jgi:hypothetical protein